MESVGVFAPWACSSGCAFVWDWFITGPLEVWVCLRKILYACGSRWMSEGAICPPPLKSRRLFSVKSILSYQSCFCICQSDPSYSLCWCIWGLSEQHPASEPWTSACLRESSLDTCLPSMLQSSGWYSMVSFRLQRVSHAVSQLS